MLAPILLGRIMSGQESERLLAMIFNLATYQGLIEGIWDHRFNRIIPLNRPNWNIRADVFKSPQPKQLNTRNVQHSPT
jgi:hypothetical protein